MVDPEAGTPVSRQLADLLRERILSGELRHGEELVAEHRLAGEHGISRDAVRAAMVILRSEGLIVTRAPYATTVRRPDRRTISVPRGSRMERVWMPSPTERRRYGVPPGVPLMEIIDPAGRSQVYPADEVMFSIS